MADPTQPLRDKVKAGVKSLLPVNSPINQSIEAEKQKESQRIATEEANNLVMQRSQPNLPQEAIDFVDPEIPITPVQQKVSTQSAATRSPAEIAPTSVSSPQPQLASADAAFDKIATEQDRLQKFTEDDFKARQLNADNKEKELNDQLAKINANPVQIDNRSLWAKSSTGQKIVLGLGALLSSLSSSGAKAFQDNIQQTIDTDLKLQVDALNQQRADKNSLLAQIQKTVGDKDAAAAAYKSQIYGIIANKLSLQAQKAQSKLQRDQAIMNYNLANEQKQIEMAKFKQTLIEKQDEGSIPGFEGMVKDPVAAREFRNKLAEKPNVLKEIDNLASINEQFLGGALSPSANASAKQSQNLLIGKLREAIVGPGTLSETDRDLLEKAIANPTDFFTLKSSNKIKLDKLKQSYNNALASHASALGLKEQGKPLSFKAQ